MSVDLVKFQSAVDYIQNHMDNYNTIPTISDIAKACKISTATASKYVSMFNIKQSIDVANLLTPSVIQKHYDLIKNDDKGNAKLIDTWYDKIAGMGDKGDSNKAPQININLVPASQAVKVDVDDAEVIDGE